MSKEEFIQYVYENYTIDTNPMARELFENVLTYAEGLCEQAQYEFLCAVIPQVPERIIARVTL